MSFTDMEFANIIVYYQCHNFRYKLRGNNQKMLKNQMSLY